MRQTLIAGNWKQNGDVALLQAFAETFLANAQISNAAQLALCVPYPLLDDALNQLGSHNIAIGAQNVAAQESGAFTGEVAASLLANVGCQYVIVGHSERRSLYGESNADVAAKATLALEAGLTPIICVGETQAEREAGEQETVVAQQLAAVADFAGTVVAYEPVWAIGTGLAATTEQAQEMHAYIRKIVGSQVQILYGGSMKSSNAGDLLQQADIDGGLIGGASLQPQDFLAIAKQVV